MLSSVSDSRGAFLGGEVDLPRSSMSLMRRSNSACMELILSFTASISFVITVFI